MNKIQDRANHLQQQHDFLKAMRLKIDALIGTVTHHTSFNDAIFRARDCLKMAKGWLGRGLALNGAVNPYPVVQDAKNIPPTADTSPVPSAPAESVLTKALDLRLEHCNKHRAEIEDVKRLIEKFIASGGLNEMVPSPHGILTMHDCFKQCYVQLTEAKMWLGYELQSIRDAALTTGDGGVVIEGTNS